MRVAYVYDALYPHVTGGAERRYFELGERLAARGHDVHFVSWRYSETTAVRHPSIRVHAVGAAPGLHDANGRRTVFEAIAFGARCVPILAGLNVDVIDCSSIPYTSTFVAAALRRRNGARLITTWHEYMGERWHSYLLRGAAAASVVERVAARVGDERVAVSGFTERRLPPGPPTRVVENGIELARIRAAVPLTDAADIVAAGRLVPHKRLDLLLRAVARLPHLTVAVIGDGPDRARLEREAAELGIVDRVRFLGWLPDVDHLYAYFSAARAVAVLSEQEGFGMTVIEAQAAGAVPIVARARFSAATELVQHGVTGMTVTADIDSVTDAIERVTQDATLRHALRDNGMQAAATYDWDLIANKIERAYTGSAATDTAPQFLASAA